MLFTGDFLKPLWIVRNYIAKIALKLNRRICCLCIEDCSHKGFGIQLLFLHLYKNV